jgi:hypothetical protein
VKALSKRIDRSDDHLAGHCARLDDHANGLNAHEGKLAIVGLRLGLVSSKTSPASTSKPN